ncbi:ankyrin repeat domain-containing protein [Actinospica robiniae]|uniref:ankyrin repeat domain-containing protein n=1 Tax=Actinospica robiniae TaxID=304901 RepID=UPI001B7FC902|nr:ankyrin repeat domain-containing protein [Actinospica robiniae]
MPGPVQVLRDKRSSSAFPGAPERRSEPHDAGHDVEDDNGDGWTLLRHAVDTEIDGHDQTGKPLHVDVTALLLARGADPLRSADGVTVVAEAERRGHWLAAELMNAWIGRSR